jgi:hypothetical protein
MSLFLKKTVEYSKNNSTVEDFAAYILSNFQLKLNNIPEPRVFPKYSKNKPKSEDIQKHFKQFIPQTEKPKPNMFVADDNAIDDLVARSDQLTKQELVSEINKIGGQANIYLADCDDLSAKEIPEVKDLYKDMSVILNASGPNQIIASVLKNVTSYSDLGNGGVISRSNLTPQHHSVSSTLSSAPLSSNYVMVTNSSQPFPAAACAASADSLLMFDGTGSTGSFKPTEKELNMTRCLSLDSRPEGKRRGRKSKVTK